MGGAAFLARDPAARVVEHIDEAGMLCAVASRCAICGYALEGLPPSREPRCPECGRPVDPAFIAAVHREAVAFGFKWLGFALSPAIALLACGMMMTWDERDRWYGYPLVWAIVAYLCASWALRVRFGIRGVTRAGVRGRLLAAGASLAYVGGAVMVNLAMA